MYLYSRTSKLILLILPSYLSEVPSECSETPAQLQPSLVSSVLVFILLACILVWTVNSCLPDSTSPTSLSVRPDPVRSEHNTPSEWQEVRSSSLGVHWIWLRGWGKLLCQSCMAILDCPLKSCRPLLIRRKLLWKRNSTWLVQLKRKRKGGGQGKQDLNL